MAEPGVTPPWFDDGMELQDLVDVLDELTACDPKDFADGEDLVLLAKQKARLEAFASLVAAAFAGGDEWRADSARSASQWLGVEGHMAKKKAKELVAGGRQADEAPLFRASWLAGRLTADHLRVLGPALSPKLHEAFARDEAELLAHGEKLRFDDFCRVVAHWLQLADPDGADAAELERQARRDVSLAQSYDGMFFGRLTLDPISGTIVKDELSRIEEGLFAADWCAAKERLGHDPRTEDLERSPAQRRADALVEMAVRSNTAPENGRRPAPLFTVLVDYDTFRGRICQLANGTVVSPIAAAQWITQCYVERAVWKAGPRVEVAPSVRLFTGASRRGLEIRDQRCSNRYCDAPVEQCEADHIIPFSEGGPTTQENGRLLCGYHNRFRNTQRPPPDF